MSSREVWGTIITIAGLILIALSFFLTPVMLIYGIPLFVVGIVILFNKREDQIERIKYKDKKGGEK